MKYAELTVKPTSWKDTSFPDKGGVYKTKQLVFVTDEGKRLRLNVRKDKETCLKFNKLKIGDRICCFRLLYNNPDIIDPNSSFELYGVKKVQPLF